MGYNVLVHIHTNFTKLKCGVSNHWKTNESDDWCPDFILSLKVPSKRENCSTNSIDTVQRWSTSEGDQDFPSCQNIVSLDLYSRCSKSLCEIEGIVRGLGKTIRDRDEYKPLAFRRLMTVAAMKIGALRTTPGRARIPQAAKRPTL